MFRFIFTRVILPLLLFFLLRYVLKTVSAGLKSTAASGGSGGQAPPIRAGGELKKDPVCGTYVAAASAITREVDGEVLHFCSKACRDKYRS
jgi:YHS domain-containing protein